jgi:hypothetical protein
MNYIYRISWTQPYYGWHEQRLQEIEKQLSLGDFSEAKLVIAKVMSR